MENKKTFNIHNALAFGWHTTKDNLGTLLLITIITIAVSALFNFFGGKSILLSVVSFLVSTYIGIMWIHISLAYAKRQPVKLNSMWTGITAHQFWVYVLASILYSLLVMIGIVLLIIPGFIFLTTYVFYSYNIIDHNAGVRLSFRESSTMTKGNRWKILGFILVLALVNVVGALLFGVGLLFTIPMTSIALAFVYQDLSNTTVVDTTVVETTENYTKS